MYCKEKSGTRDSCSDVQNLSAAASQLSPGAGTLEKSPRAGTLFQGIGHYREGVQVRSGLHHPTGLNP